MVELLLVDNFCVETLICWCAVNSANRAFHWCTKSKLHDVQKHVLTCNVMFCSIIHKTSRNAGHADDAFTTSTAAYRYTPRCIPSKVGYNALNGSEIARRA